MTNTPVGLVLATLPDVLVKVADEHAKSPATSFNLYKVLGPKAGTATKNYLESRYGNDFKMSEHFHDLPIQVYQRAGVDITAKLIASSIYCLDSKLQEELHLDPTHLLLHKIRSSMWRWGGGRPDWNEKVDCYNNLRSFDFGVDGFSVTLDHTAGYNERGRGVHSNTYFDGVFAYLVHYKGEHVMTIGFSLVAGRQLCLQQVQLKQARGNRWLFKLGANRVEHALDRLAAAFPGFTLSIADGHDIGNTSLQSYKQGLEAARKDVKRYKDRLAVNDNQSNPDLREYYRDARLEAKKFRAKVKGLKEDLPRLQALYANSGRYAQGEAVTMNGIKHYRLAA